MSNLGSIPWRCDQQSYIIAWPGGFKAQYIPGENTYIGVFGRLGGSLLVSYLALWSFLSFLRSSSLMLVLIKELGVEFSLFHDSNHIRILSK
jgi:hypothetical protein